MTCLTCMGIFDHTMKKILTLALFVLSAACASTTTTAVMGGPGIPNMPDVQYRIVGPVEGRGSIMQISPRFLHLFGAPTAKDAAIENAIGSAIYSKDDIDVMIAPKSRVKVTDFLGLYSMAEAEVKGQGCQLIGPK